MRSHGVRVRDLGLSFKACQTLTVDVTTFLRSLSFIRLQALYVRTPNMPSLEVTKLFLVESYCSLLTTYGCEALNFNSHIIHQLSVCWNNAYKRIFITIVGSRLRPCTSIVVDRIFIMYMWNENLLFYEHCVNWTVWWFVRVVLFCV